MCPEGPRQAHEPHLVNLDFMRYNRINAGGELGKGLAKHTNLTMVDVSFTRCNLTNSVDELGLARLTNLTKVDLSFTCGPRQAHEPLQGGLELFALQLDHSVDELGKSLAKLTNLTKVDLSFTRRNRSTPGRSPARASPSARTSPSELELQALRLDQRRG